MWPNRKRCRNMQEISKIMVYFKSIHANREDFYKCSKVLSRRELGFRVCSALPGMLPAHLFPFWLKPSSRRLSHWPRLPSLSTSTVNRFLVEDLNFLGLVLIFNFHRNLVDADQRELFLICIFHFDFFLAEQFATC